MRYWIIFAGVLGLAVGSAFLWKDAACAAGFCPNWGCYGACGGTCVCVTPPNVYSGTCVSVEHSQKLIAKGYRILK